MSLTHFLDLSCLIWQMLELICAVGKNIITKKKRICQTLLKVSQEGYIIKTILKSFNSYTKNKQHSEMRLYNALTFKC